MTEINSTIELNTFTFTIDDTFTVWARYDSEGATVDITWPGECPWDQHMEYNLYDVEMELDFSAEDIISAVENSYDRDRDDY